MGNRHLRFIAIIAAFIGVTALVAFVFAVRPPAVHAATTTFSVESIGSQIGLGNADLKQTVINIIKWALGFLSLLAVSYLIYGGVVWMTAAGNEQRVEKAKRIILQALIGIVIVLLSWAIVLFVQRTFARVTTTGTPGHGPPGCPLCPPPAASTFNVTDITSCAVPPEYSKDVPLASAVAITFNDKVDAKTVEAAVKNTDPSQPNLIVQKCADPTCDRAGLSTPKPLTGQVYVPGKDLIGAPGAPKPEWHVTSPRSVTFYHMSFSSDPASPDYFLFEPTTTYLLTMPKRGAATMLTDKNNRPLDYCRKDPKSPLGGIPGDSCDDLTFPDRIVWKFTTGTEVAGPELSVASTSPSSKYEQFAECTGTPKTCSAGMNAGKACSASTDCQLALPDRNVNRFPTMVVTFNVAIDQNLVDIKNFEMYEYTAAPNPVTGQGGTLGPALDPAKFDPPEPLPNGAMLHYTENLKPYTWYKVVAKDFRNLCGVKQTTPYAWVFETNNTVPGVKKVYPPNEFAKACPSTKILIEYNTSMFNVGGGSLDCNPGAAGSYVTDGKIQPGDRPRFEVLDPYPGPPADPNKYCRNYAFVPETAELKNNTSYSLGVNSSLKINSAGDTLNYGDLASPSPARKPWHFTTATPSTCIQPPLITSISPNHGPNGQCISVLGKYFTDAQTPGNKIELDTVNQGTALSWKDSAIVSSIDSGAPALAPGDYDYKVTVRYPSADLSDLDTFTLEDMPPGGPSLGPCLVSVNPDHGLVGDKVSASGKRFLDFGSLPSPHGVFQYTGSSTVNWDTPTSAPGWSDTNISPIGITLATPTGDGQVSVIDKNGSESNSLPFTVDTPATPLPGAPRVEESTICNLGTGIYPSPNPRKNDTKACVNGKAGARFTIDMDVGTFTNTNIKLSKCTAPGNCPTDVPAVVTPDGLRRFSLVPNVPGSRFDGGQRYRVMITTGVKSAMPDHISLTSAYSWEFTTNAGGDCPISAVGIDIVPQKYTFSTVPFSVVLPAKTFDVDCHDLGAAGTVFNWMTSNDKVAVVTPTTGTPVTAHDPAPALPDDGTADITVTAQTKTSPPVSITFDSTACTKTAQCKTNGLGEACPLSVCDNGHCTPELNAIEHNDGDPGNLVTFKGCWFGGYNPAVSTTKFTPDTEGLIPDPAICGSRTWTNERIYREVPNLKTPAKNATTGKVFVHRADGVDTSDSIIFTVNGKKYPGACQNNPNHGKPTTPFSINGFAFGATPGAANITPLSATAIPLSPVVPWEEHSVSTKVPAVIPTGYAETRVIVGGVLSNPVVFKVDSITAPACTACGPFVPCAGAGMGCGTDHCCYPIPKIVSIVPPPPPTGVCRNTGVMVTFSQPIDGGKVKAADISYQDGPTPVTTGRVSVTNSAFKGYLVYQPGLVSANATQTFGFAGDIYSLMGVKADLAGSPVTFKTGAEICTIDKIIVTPATHTFTTVGEVYDSYVSQAWSNKVGAPLSHAPAVYDWKTDWLVAKPDLATALSPTAEATKIQAQSKNGITTAMATATITDDTTPAKSVGRKISGSGEIVVDLCKFPWSATFEDTETSPAAQCPPGPACSFSHFTLSYCRGNEAASLLPDFTYRAIEGQNAVDPTRIKSFFFKANPDARDAIGILVFDNPEFLSPADWFMARFPTISIAATTTIGGYPAIKTGTTTYIGFTDFNAGKLVGKIIVFDYNSNSASPETKLIYQQFLDRLRFNTNVASYDDRQRIVKDTRRRQDLAAIKVLAETYKTKNGAYPNLAAGSYLTGISTSKWPSWQQTLGNTLARAVPVDPINTFDPICTSGDRCVAKKCATGPKTGQTCKVDDDCNAYETSTCWAEPLKQFKCPADSHLYAYKSDPAGSAIQLYTRMEYTGSGTFINSPPDPCPAPSSCGCFNYVTP